MTEQLSLGLARASDPQTSHDAARQITGKTERLIIAFLDAMSAWGNQDFTADELQQALPDIYGPTLVSALSRLKNHSLIEPTGGERPSRRGCAQSVYRLKELEAATFGEAPVVEQDF